MQEAAARTAAKDTEASELAHVHRFLTTELQHIRSGKDLERHPGYRAKRDRLERLLGTPRLYPPPGRPAILERDFLRVTAWNVERGTRFDGIVEALRNDSELADSDIFLLTETDFGMARSGNRHVARELGRALGLYAAFVPCFLNLDKGNGAEAGAQGENTVALQGHAILSRHPLEKLGAVPLPNSKDHASGRERQIGREQALVATAVTPHGPIRLACVHLSAHSAVRHRLAQMKRVVAALEEDPGPALIGGDWNTSTYNAHGAFWAILSFWRRVAMGTPHVVQNHYPYPERYFERRLFDHLEARGFDWRTFNVPGKPTVQYDFHQADVNLSLRDWIPSWCFPYVRWALRSYGGRCWFKLDWFAGRGLRGFAPLVVDGHPRGADRLSDHAPVRVDVRAAGG